MNARFRILASGIVLGFFVVDTLPALGEQPAESNATTGKVIQQQQRRRMASLERSQQQIKAAGPSVSYGDWTNLGDAQLRAGKNSDSVTSFENAIKLRPDAEPYLWQYGIALFFVDRFDDGQKLFEKHRKVNPNDVENAAWHFLCVAKAKDVEQARRILLPAPDDRRAPMSEILDRLPGGDDGAIIDRMKTLQGSAQASSANFYGNLYLGIIADAEGDSSKAKEKMEIAAATSATHYMADIARVYLEHLKK